MTVARNPFALPVMLLVLSVHLPPSQEPAPSDHFSTDLDTRWCDEREWKSEQRSYANTECHHGTKQCFEATPACRPDSQSTRTGIDSNKREHELSSQVSSLQWPCHQEVFQPMPSVEAMNHTPSCKQCCYCHHSTRRGGVAAAACLLHHLSFGGATCSAPHAAATAAYYSPTQISEETFLHTNILLAVTG
jgi:hypothetical protein